MTLSRRRFLSVASAACLAGTAVPAFQWQGTALGARARILLDHPDAERITARARAEITRLEEVFSLYRPTSEISRLNAAGQLAAPSCELLDCLGIARHVHRLTEGRFDPTVQPLWQALAAAYVDGRVLEAAQLAVIRQSVGFDRVHFDSAAVTLAVGQQITLNGIAQGYIADRVAGLMRAFGVTDVLIDTGEIVAMGAPKGREGWPIATVGDVKARVLTGRAIATSAPFGTVFGGVGGAGNIGHILDPRSGAALASDIRQISVSAPNAALADGISTGLCLTKNAADARRLLRNVKDVALENVQTTAKAI